MSLQLQEQCGDYAIHVLKPLLDYFKQVNLKIDLFDSAIESKNNQIRQLEEKESILQREVTHLKIELATAKAKEDNIKLLQDRDADHIKSLKQEIQTLTKLFDTQAGIKEISDTQLNSKGKGITAKDEKVILLENEVNKLKYSKQELNRKIAELNSKILSDSDKANKCETELKSQIVINSANAQKIINLETDLKKSHGTNDNERKRKNTLGCIGTHSTGVQNVTISNGLSFEVLCNSDIAGPGWTVIQQRINGGVDFYRDWETYRTGFGDFWNGDFFLGLEKIHKLTTRKPHELYIYMKRFDGSTYFARYDEFAITGEIDQYRLIRLSGFSGTAGIPDFLSYHKSMQFSTYDRDNDKSAVNCASNYHNAWWNRNCYHA